MKNLSVERWEYNTVIINRSFDPHDDSYMEELNDLRLEGWELVSTQHDLPQGCNYFYFKRRLP